MTTPECVLTHHHAQRDDVRTPGHRPAWRSGSSRPSRSSDALVSLRDGSRATIRPVRASDAALLLDGFARLGDSSRRLRFLSAKPELSAKEVRYLTEVDHHDHEALAAISQVDGRGVGVARYIRSVDDPEVAEIAVTVVDEWQSRGLGTELLARLTFRAAQEGIRHFTALVSAENFKVTKLLHANGGELTVLGRAYGTVDYRLAIAEARRRRDGGGR